MVNRERRKETRVGNWPEVKVDPADITGDYLPALIRAAGQLADHCEHIEHNESPAHSVATIAEELRQTAARMAQRADLDLGQLYAARIQAVESASMMRFVGFGEVRLAGFEIMSQARTWHEFQLGQLAHDRQFHPDVFGLSGYEQLRHYSFHVTKLPWLLQEAVARQSLDQFYATRLPDIALFGIKLAILIKQRLPDDPIAG